MEKLASEVQVGEVIQATFRNFRVERIDRNRPDGFTIFWGSSVWRENDLFKVRNTSFIQIIEGNSDLENNKESARLYFETLKSN